MTLRIEPLGKAHDRTTFSCGDAALDEWFRKRAGQDERRNVARVFVAVDGGAVAGFYSLGAFTLALADMPEAVSAKLPRYDAIPAALIGRLARNLTHRGCGIGELLLADAIRRVVGVSQELAVFAIVVDAKNVAAADFYRSFGFIAFPQVPGRLFMLVSTAAAGLAKSA